MQLLAFLKKQHARLKDKGKREMAAVHVALSKAQEQRDVKINLCWIPGPLLPADINSKSLTGEFQLTKIWKHGPPLFCTKDILNHSHGYLTNGQIFQNPDFRLQEPGVPEKIIKPQRIPTHLAHTKQRSVPKIRHIIQHSANIRTYS